MSPVVLQLFPTLSPHKAGCMSPLMRRKKITLSPERGEKEKKKFVKDFITNYTDKLPFT